MQGLMIRPAAGTDDDKKGGETRKARPVRQQGGLSAGRCWEPRITDPAADCGGLDISASNGGRTHRHGGEASVRVLDPSVSAADRWRGYSIGGRSIQAFVRSCGACCVSASLFQHYA